MRVRKHKVVLNRSRGGDTGIFVILAIMGVIMFLPMLYTIMQSLKPLDELWYFPPKFYVINPTIKNFTDLFRLMGQSWVPFSRYIYNTVVISVGGTFGHLLIASMAAYVLAKMKFPGKNLLFQIVVLSLMFHATVGALAKFIIMSYIGMIDTMSAIIIPAFLALTKPPLLLCIILILLSSFAYFSKISGLLSVEPSFTQIISSTLYV